MAMRCFGRAFDFGLVFDAALATVLTALLAATLGLTAGRPLALDLMVLRDEDLVDVPSPAHFFFTAVLAAALEVAFCLAIFCALPDRLRREASTKQNP